MQVEQSSYHWTLDPPDAGTVSGTGTSISVTWDVNFTGKFLLNVAGVNNGCEGPASNPLSIIRYLPEVTLEPFDYVQHDWPAFELTGGNQRWRHIQARVFRMVGSILLLPGLEIILLPIPIQMQACAKISMSKILTVVLEIGINEQNNLKVNISPNPNDGFFTLNAKFKQFKKL